MYKELKQEISLWLHDKYNNSHIYHIHIWRHTIPLYNSSLKKKLYNSGTGTFFRVLRPSGIVHGVSRWLATDVSEQLFPFEMEHTRCPVTSIINYEPTRYNITYYCYCNHVTEQYMYHLFHPLLNNTVNNMDYMMSNGRKTFDRLRKNLEKKWLWLNRDINSTSIWTDWTERRKVSLRVSDKSAKIRTGVCWV